MAFGAYSLRRKGIASLAPWYFSDFFLFVVLLVMIAVFALSRFICIPVADDLRSRAPIGRILYLL